MVSLVKSAKYQGDIKLLEAVKHSVSVAKSKLIMQHVFFGTVVAKRPIIYTSDVPTAGMAANGQMYINPEFVRNLSVKQLMFLLAHEAMHYMLCHSLRRGNRDAAAWNIACDKVINDTLINAGVGEFISGGVTEAGARDVHSEALYDSNDEGRDVGGTGSDIGDPEDGNGNAMSSDEQEKHQAQVKIEVSQAVKVAKACGQLPDGVKRLVDEIIEPKTPWHDILRRVMTALIKDGTTWKRPNRRFVHQGLYLPGPDDKPKLGTVVIGVDTSGSIGGKELAEFNGHINSILDTCRPEKVIVMYCDSVINKTVDYTPDDFPVKLEAIGGGGTRFEPVFAATDELEDDVECIVYLTDGYGDQNSFTTHHKTFWLTTGTTNFDWGTVIEFTPEE